MEASILLSLSSPQAMLCMYLSMDIFQVHSFADQLVSNMMYNLFEIVHNYLIVCIIVLLLQALPLGLGKTGDLLLQEMSTCRLGQI